MSSWSEGRARLSFHRDRTIRFAWPRPSRLLGVVDRGRACALEALEHALADRARVVEVLEEIERRVGVALELGDARRAERVRLAARRDDEHVVLDVELQVAECVLAPHDTPLCVDAARLEGRVGRRAAHERSAARWGVVANPRSAVCAPHARVFGRANSPR